MSVSRGKLQRIPLENPSSLAALPSNDGNEITRGRIIKRAPRRADRYKECASVNYRLCSSVPFISVPIAVSCHVSPTRDFSADDHREPLSSADGASALLSRCSRDVRDR